MASEYLKNKAKQAAERVTKEYGGNAYGGTKWLNGNTSASKTSTTSSTSSNKKINTTNGSTRISTSGDEDVGYSPRLISNTQSRWSSLANNKAAKQYEEDNPYRNYNRQRIDKAVTDLSDELDQTVSSEGRAAVQARLNKALSRQQELMSYDELKARQQTYQDAIDYHYANNVDRLDGEEPNEWAKTRVNELNQEKALAGNSLVEKSVNETMRSITGETKTAVNKYLQAAEDYVKAYQANPGKGKDKEQFYLTAYEQEAKKALQNAGYDETAIANLLEQTKRYVNENAWQSINDMWALNEDSTIANIAKGIAGTGVGILTSPLRALGFGEAVRSKTSKSDYATMDEYSGYFAPQNLANAAYNGVKDKVDWNVNIGRTDYDVFDMLYDTTTSGLESALSMVTGSALTGNAGAATKISGAMLGASAATSTMQDLTSRGASAGMALTGGIVAGIFESLFENLSIGSFKALQEVPVTTWRDWLRNVGKSMLVNFEEEGATELANIIFDTVAMGDYSNYNIMLQTYLESGKTNDEAVKLIAKDFALQVLEAAAGGGIMGLGFSNVGNAANIYGRRAGIGNVISSAGAQQDLINEGLLSGEGTRSNMLANKYNGRSRLTDYQLGKLVEANEQAIQDEETAKSAAIDTAIDSAIEETTEADETLEQNPFEGLGATEQGATATVEAASGEETDAGFSEWLTQLGSGLGKNGQESLRAGYIGGDVETYAGEFLTYYAAGYANENIVDTIDAQSDAVTMNGTQIQLAYEAGVADRMADDAKGGNTSSPEAATASLMDAETSDYTNNTEAVTNGTEQQTTRQAQQLVASEYGPNGGTGAERPISVDSGGQSAAVAAGTSQTAGRQSSSGKTGRSARRSSFESSDGRVSTSASIGLANGTNDAVLVISNEALRAKDEDTYNVKRTLEGMGVRVTVVSGNLHSVSTQNGNVVASRGAFQTDDDGLPHIFIQADNKNLDGRTIAKHELFHLLCKRAPSLKNRVRDSILKDHSTAELRAMVKNYAWLYFTGEEVTPELTKYILEEIYADAYAGIDVFKNVGMNYFEGATKFSKGVYENVSNFDEMQPAGEASENVREEGKASEGGKLSREELDEEYLTAVERGDVETARRMVRETAKQNGYTTQMLYHGTGRFGYTSYDMNAGTNSKGMIYATDKANVAANYGGSRNVYAHQRNINRKLTQGNSVKAVIHNAESVLGMKTHVVTADERKAAIKNVIKGFENIAEVLNSVDFDDLAKIPGWNNEDYRNSVASSWDMTTDIVWTVLGEYATNEDGTWEGDGYEDLKTAVERFEEYYPKFREALIAEKENIKGASVEALYDLLLKHTLFDAAVDAKYTMLPLVKNDGTVLTDGRQFREKDELAAAIDKVKDVGTYMLYGNPGDNILEVDANGRDWLSLKAPKVDDRYHSTDTIANWAKEQGYTSVYVKNVYDGGDKANEYIFFNPEQLKSADPVTYDDNGDVIPLSQRFNRKVQDIRFSQETELTDGQRASIIRLNDTSTGSVKAESGDIRFSLIENENITNRTMEYFSNPKNKVNHITRKELESANGIVDQMVEYMKPWLDSVNSKGGRYLPEEILGDTRFNNGSYGRTIENTTICFRTLAYIDFTNAIKEELGRPLTVEESFLASQMLYDIAKEPQCLYCYVSLDRKAYDEFLMKYVEQRDSVLEKFNALSDSEKETELQRIEAYNNFRDEAYANNDKTAAKKQVNDYLKNDAKKDPLFKEFLQRRKATEEMRRRFDMWITYAANGDRLIRLADLTTEEKRSRIKAADGVMAAQMKDAEAYAQSASWAKKLEQYRSYNGEILTMTNDLVETLNKEYGLRFYSFSEYTPAFIVENMQQIRDAAVKGFYGLAYTKKPDFARIFAPTGMNINISVFARMDGDKIVPDTLQGADWDEVKGLRAKYSNVGAVFVATTDEMVDWALEQDWIDVVIPFHIVRTGANVAEFYKWVNHTSQQADKTKGGKKADITPSEHNNDFDTYKSLIDERNLIPRFQKWYDRVGKGLSKENYMKLVNETRRSASESEKLKPNYDESVLSEAKRSFNQFVKDGGYYGDWYEEGMDYSEAVQTVANDIRSGKRANEVSYGRQDFDATEAMKNRRNRANRAHGQMLSREEPAGLASDYVVDLDDPNISELKENLTWGEASNLLDDLKGLSYRFRNKPDPMSRAEYAMFADRLESVSHYGAYAFSVDESTLTDVQDIMPKILDAWHDMEETDPDMLEYFFGYWDVEGLSDDEITAAFDPEDIVQSAEAYDDERAVAWLWEFVLEPNNIGGIKTNDGAIVLDRNLIKRNLVAEVFTQGERDDDQMLSREVSNQDVLKLMKKTSALEEKVEYWKKQSMTSKAKAKELEKQAEASAKVAESNRQQAEYWKKQTKVSEVPSVDQKSLSKATTSIMAVNCTMYALGTDADRKEVRQRLEELYNFIERGGDEEDELTWTGVWDWATDIARYIAKYSYHLDGDREMVNRARQYLKTHKFYIDPGNAPADFGGWRKEHFGTINVAKGKAPGRVSIDTCWAEMQEILGEGFAREDVDHPWDQLELVVETVARLENTYLGDSDRAYLTNALARTILDEYYNVKEEKTYADRMTKKLNDQKIKNSELKREEREKREKAVAKEREKAKAKLEKEREENRARIEALKQKINDNHEKQMQELKQRYADTEAKRKERQEQRKLKDRINKHVSELSEMLTKPTDKKHIPQRLQSSVANLLESINLESSWSYDDTGKLQRKPGGSPTKRTQAFAKLRDLYKEIGSELVIDPDLLGDAETKGLLDDCIALRDVRIDDMNVEQLSTVLKAVQAIGATIKSSNKMFNSARWATVHEAAAKLQADNATKKMPAELRGFAGRLVTWETLGNMTPDVYMSMLGKTGEELFRVMRNAQDKQTTLIAEAAKFTESLNIKDARKWEQETHKVTLGGQQVELNTAQIMALYCLARRDQGTQHIYAGGILPDTIQKKGALRNTNVADPIRGITPSELSDTFSVLTLEQRLSAQSMQSFLSKEVADWGNEASMAVYGYKKFGEDHYWPIHAQEIAKTVENHNRVASVSNKGFTKAVEPKATNSLRVSSIFDDFSGHIQEMATYAAWLETSEDLRRIRNYIFRDEEGNRLGTIEGTLKRVHGSRGAAYWDQLQSDIAMGTDPDRVGAGLTGGLTGRFKAAAVGGNIRVIIQQPTAIFRALDMISPTYLMRPSNIMKGWEKAKKYAPIALWKDWGYFEISTGKRMKDVMFKSETTLDKLQRASMWGAGMADSIAWGQLWNACEAEAKAKKKDLKPGTKEFYETVAERFTEIVDRTQVVDGILQRSQNMRSRNELNKMASSFMAEPTKQLNMAMIAAYNLKHSTKGNRKAALGHMARTATALTVSGVINAVAQSIVDAWRDDDRDKDYIERWLESFWGFTGDEESAKDYWDSFWEGNLENPLIITNYLPYMQDVVSLLQGYDVERMDMAIVSDFITAGNTFVKALKGTNKYTIQGAATDLLTTSSKLLGLPLATLERDVKGLLNAYATESNNYVLQYHLDKFWYKTSGEGANRTTFMDTLYRAYTSDGGQYRQIWQDMRANGVTLEQVRSAMESRMAADQGVAGATDLAQRWISPDNIDKYAGCVDELNGNGIYRTMSNEDQKTCRDLIYKYLTEIEKRDVGETEGYKVSDATSKALEMQEHGITFAEYAIFKVSTGDLESDKDEEGKTISGSLKEKRTDAVEDMDFLTSNQKDYLFSQWYSNLEDLPW